MEDSPARNGDIFIIRMLVDNWKTLGILTVFILSFATAARAYDRFNSKIKEIDDTLDAQVNLNSVFSNNQKINIVGTFYLTCRQRTNVEGETTNGCNEILNFAPELRNPETLATILQNLYTGVAQVKASRRND